ncbi:MAG TPA: hypothetical protein VFG47_10370, partial [Geminicoccaceae bacterium]|nr:hypothetical protein [Geminicoccaceae bacterium]
VTTLAGTGRRGPALRGAMPAAGAALASPWDLELRGRRLFFANAGTHQLGELDLDALTVRPLAGTGGEDIRDGPAAEALLAQPSGLALDPSGGTLYFADSETSAVRAVSLSETPPRVTTLVGAGLFDFGHRNGPFEQARLQHPLGVAWHEGGLLVADSYNGEVRRLDLARREVRDLDGGRFTCQDPICLPLGEPAGLAPAGPDRVLLVDTNNHRVLEYRLDDLTYRTWLR